MVNDFAERCVPLIYTTIGAASSKFDTFQAERSQFDTDHDQIWQACADRSGNGSYLKKLAPWTIAITLTQPNT